MPAQSDTTDAERRAAAALRRLADAMDPQGAEPATTRARNTMQTMTELYEQQLKDVRKMIQGVLSYPGQAATALPELHRAEERLLAQLMKVRGESGRASEEADAEG